MSPRTSTTLPRSSRSFSHHVETLSTIPAWLFEPKYDGYRGLLYVTRQGCYFRSKRGNILNHGPRA